MGVRTRLGAVVAIVATSLVASACGRAVDTSEVAAASVEDGVRLATSTTVPAATGASVAGSRATRPTTAAGTEPELAEFAELAAELLDRLSSNPQLVAQLLGADDATLAGLIGSDPATLARLGITPDAVRTLAAVLSGVDTDTLRRLAGGGGRPDPELAATILSLAAQLDPGVAATIRGLDPRAVAILLGTASTVDPKVIDSLAAVLTAVPSELSRLASDRQSLAILAVLIGAALGSDPSQLAALAAANRVDPNLLATIQGIRTLAAGLTPTVINQLNRISRILGPDAVQALSSVLALLSRSDISPIIEAAARDPLVLATTIGTASLLVPGLAEALSPEVFGRNPTARYVALVGLVGLAIANIQGLNLDLLATLLGLPRPAGG